MACRILVAFLILIFSHFPFFPLPWWERIKVRGMLGFPTILASNTKPSTKSWFHPHPDLLPSREKESKSVIARSAATWQSHPPAPSLRGAQRRGNLIFKVFVEYKNIEKIRYLRFLFSLLFTRQYS
jgi:hypothetical protein